MSQISKINLKYICFSDFHLGEEDGLLTNLQSGKSIPDPLTPCPVLISLAECLEELVSNSTDLPYLIILGDGLELALATLNQAAMVFERMLEEFFIKRKLFKGIIYIPGNHDHHLWETAREIQYTNYISRKYPQGSKLPVPWHISELFAKKKHHFVPSPFLEKFIHRLSGLEDLPVGILYPNFGMVNKETKRLVCLHHGHLIEEIYLFMTELKIKLFPDEKKPCEDPELIRSSQPCLDALEAENFAWIDFLWSTLGRSGRVGNKIETIYEKLEAIETLKDLIEP